MNDQRLENLLNLSLDATAKERAESEALEEGYSPATDTWELIVQYHGNLLRYQSEEIRIEPLIDGYAIVWIREPLIEAFARLEEVEYIEKPKRLVFATTMAARASCIYQVTEGAMQLTGEGVLVAVLDSGVAYYRREFRTASDQSRILALLDQTTGVEYNREKINEALRAPNAQLAQQIVASTDQTGHGTAVAGIVTQIAPECDLVVVKLGRSGDYTYPRTTELMRALKFAVQKALFYNRPMVINISLGSSYGPHDGTGLLERYIDRIAQMGKLVICIGSGNEGSNSGHYYGRINGGMNGYGRRQELEFSVARYEGSLSLQIWQSYQDVYRMTLISPDGVEHVLPELGNAAVRIPITGADALIYLGEPTPYSMEKETYFDLIPTDDFLPSGIWRIRVEGLEVRNGQFNAYLPSQEARQPGTRFIRPATERTLTIPSTAGEVITVGAYDARTDSYADFSGRGYVSELGGEMVSMVKPELVAPGVNLRVLAGESGTTVVSGTSFATPIVAAGAALLMEWGITKGNDPYLYGAKCKAYLIRGARRFGGFNVWPNELVGWGALCLADSFPTVE